MVAMEVLVVLGYEEKAGVRRSVSLPWVLLKSIALGEVCPTTLRESERRALIENSYLREEGGEYFGTPRLAWQTGVPCG